MLIFIAASTQHTAQALLLYEKLTDARINYMKKTRFTFMHCAPLEMHTPHIRTHQSRYSQATTYLLVLYNNNVQNFKVAVYFALPLYMCVHVDMYLFLCNVVD